MNEQMQTNHLRSLYQMLGHKGYYTRMGALDVISKDYKEEYVQGEEAVIKFAQFWHGKRNVFISRSGRNSQHVPVSCSVISFDVDPVRPKGESSTDEQHRNALGAAKEILAHYPGGYCASSGNGSLIVYHSGSFVDNCADYNLREKEVIEELQHLVGEKFNVKIDSTSYSQAVIKAIGTLSTKGKLRRCSRWIDYPVPPYRNCSKLLERLTQIKPERLPSVRVPDLGTSESRYKGDRSEADYGLVSFLHRSGVGPEAAIQALQSNPLGRQTDTKDQARLIGKIYGQASANIGNGKASPFAELFKPDSEKGQLIRTGFKSLDDEIGPFPPGEIVCFAARSGYGKSSFACTVAERLRKDGKRVLYLSTEMSEQYIVYKLSSISTGIELDKYIKKELSSSDLERIKGYEDDYIKHSIKIIDSFSPPLEQVKREMTIYNPDLIVLDHANNVETHWENLANYLKGLKEAAKENNIPVLCMAQMNEPPRGSKGEEMQTIRGDIRGSKELLNLAAVFMYSVNPYQQPNSEIQPVEIHIAKNRYGTAGGVVELVCHKPTSRYTDKSS